MYKFDSIKPVLTARRQSLSAENSETTNNIDTLGFAGGLCVALMMIDQISNSVPLILQMEIQESDDGSAWTTVPGCSATSDTQANGLANEGFPAGDDDHSLITFYIPLNGTRKRYLRSFLANGNSNSLSYSCSAILLGATRSVSPAESSDADGIIGQMFRATN